MKTALAALTVFLLSCSQAGSPGASSAASSGRETPGTPSGQPLPSSTPQTSGNPPNFITDFSCRLPVASEIRANDGSIEYDGGFIEFPTTLLTADPAGVIRRPVGQDLFVTVASPTLNGTVLHGPPFSDTPFYDSAVRRWVPINSGQSRSDGLHYAYTTADAQGLRIHVVDVQTATDKSYVTDLPTWNFVADYDSGIVYLTGTALGGPGIGIWAFNPATGTSRQLSAESGVLAIRGGYAWMGRFDPRDQTPQGYSELAPVNTIVRVALASGAETVWYYHPGQFLELTGFDARGEPVIGIPHDQQSFDATELRWVQQPGTSGLVISQGGITLGPPQGDGDRLWFGGPNGIYLYTSARGLVKVFNISGNDNLTIYPAGYCV